MKTQNLKFIVLALIFVLASCAEKAKESEKKVDTMKEVSKAPVYNTDNPRTILESVEYAQGGWGDLWNKKDVQYTYKYYNPAMDKADLSTERYIFKDEVSYGDYTKHEINVLPKDNGDVVQYFNGENTVVMANGKKVEDPKANGVGDFLRKANYFWFVMSYKLNDKATVVTYQGQEDLNNKTYDKVKVTYNPKMTGKMQNDTYILYVNPETKLIDRFFFSLPAMGVKEPVIISDLHYEEINGQMVATKRENYMPSEKGYSEKPNLVQTLTDISFNNGFNKENITK